MYKNVKKLLQKDPEMKPLMVQTVNFLKIGRKCKCFLRFSHLYIERCHRLEEVSVKFWVSNFERNRIRHQ